MAANGSLYGTTFEGGATNSGTVFEVSQWRERVIHSFDVTRSVGSYYRDGFYPTSSLTWLNGAFYGTTFDGGAKYAGSVFSISPTGQERVIYSFKGYPDGRYPRAPLIAANGKLYGTTTYGGKGCGQGCGTVFEVSTSGVERVLHRFLLGPNGYHPNDSALAYLNGILYGGTSNGGVPDYCGVVYAVDTRTQSDGARFDEDNNRNYRILHAFTCGKDGSEPNGLTEYNGILYGTTFCCEAQFFSLTPSGKKQVLYTFKRRPDADQIEASLTVHDGTFYGTSASGGTTENGTVFSVTPSGSESVLYSFQGGTDGRLPYSQPVVVGNTLYGTTYAGGNYGCQNYGCGTIFQLKL